MVQSRTNRRSMYTLRIMISLAISLLLVGVAFNIPFTFKPQPASWRLPGRHAAPVLGVQDIGRNAALGIPMIPSPSAGPAPVPPAPHEMQNEKEAESHSSAADPVPEHSVLLKVAHRPVLSFVDTMPKVRGGLAAYYIHIEYPEEAKRRGIQGRLVLDFVVEPDGTTSHVHVMDALHPLCDSAAVHALRHTTFIPGQHQGKPERVRMRLPVRFVLINADSLESATG